MGRKIFVWLLVIFFLISAPVAQAQQGAKIFRIGFLSASGRPTASTSSNRSEAFREGLRELGYVEGKNIIIEWRYVEGKAEFIHSLAAELVRLKVDVIVTAGPTPTRAAKGATATIPIVMMQDPDPVGNGFVASLARPGGNITGLSTHAPEISGKQLEILKETIPKLSRVAILGTSTSPGYALSLKEMELAAEALGVKLQHVDMPISPSEIETAFRAASKARAGALQVLGGTVLSPQRALMADFAVKNRLPAMYYSREFVEAGGLMTYAANLRDLDRRAAAYVDKILKGAKPADLPVEQPMKFEFIVNLQAAKKIGLTVPPNVLVRADRVIK